MSAQLKIHKTQPATTSLSKPSSYFTEGVYVDPELVADLQVYRSNKTTVFVFKASSASDFVSWANSRVTAFSYPVTQLVPKENIQALAERLCEEHPAISTDPGIFGGSPHINNFRLTVANVLAKVRIYGSTKAVADIYAPYIEESQIKEAIAYAQDFLEEALYPSQPS